MTSTSATRRRPVSGRQRLIRMALRAILAGAVMLAGILTVAFIDANWRFARQEAAAPARIYSSPYALHEDLALDRQDLFDRLSRLGYRRVEGRPTVPGEYGTRFRSAEIYLNAFDYPEGRQEPRLVRVRLSGRDVREIDDPLTGERLLEARLEPEPLGVLSGDLHEERIPVRLEEMARPLIDAVVAVEDRRFHRHAGIDPRAVLRAAFANLRSGEVVQGGSTITQQLAKNLYDATGERTLVRKVWETLAAVSLETMHGKDAILERYLNQIYLAQRGPISILGVGAAARHYFGKDPAWLDLPQSALLAGLIQSPGRYHPYRNPDAARERRNLVLKRMLDEGSITADQERSASAAPLELRQEQSHDPRQAPYFVDYVAEEIKALGLRDPASHLGLRIFTTLDPLLQSRAEAVLENSLKRFETDFKQLRPMPGGALQGAVVVLRPVDGSIAVMVGGRSYAVSQFNRVTQAHRQPGSLFKPFVYLTGFRLAQMAGDASFTPGTVLDDSPLEMVVADTPWAPRNFDEQYRGPVSARQALALSLNVPTIRAAEMVGLREVVRTARQCGIKSRLQPVPSIALGTFEVTPLEMAASFTPLATLGWRSAPRAITAIVDDGGRERSLPEQPPEQVVTAQAAYLTLDLMRDVVRYGTGAAIGSFGLRGPFAGKTGTTDDGRDAWFAGFHPDYLGLVWVGFDNNRPLRLGGSSLALPIWAQLAARSGIDMEHDWREPEGLVERDIDPLTGKLSGWRCSDSVREIFIAGSEPTEKCEHERGSESWANRFLNWFRHD